MAKILLTSVIFWCLTYGCGKTNQLSQKAEVPELDSTDYEIISAALEWYLKPYMKGSFPEKDSMFYNKKDFGSSKAETIIISDSTHIEPLSNWSFDKDRKADTSDTYITDRLRFENRKKLAIDNTKITSFKTYKLSASDHSTTFRELYLKYPDAWGVVGFSKASRNLNEGKAVIYVWFQKAGLWGRGAYMWLKKQENTNWIPYDTVELWVS